MHENLQIWYYQLLWNTLSGFLMVVTTGQDQRKKAAGDQGDELFRFESSASSSSQFGEHVHCRHVQEGSGREQHGDPSGIESWQSFFTLL